MMTSDLKALESRFRQSVIKHFESVTQTKGMSFDANRVAIALDPNGTTLVTAPTNNCSQLAYVYRMSDQSCSRLKPGLYEISIVDALPKLYYLETGGTKTLVDLKIPDKDPVKISTPIGDWMCENAPGSLQETCQSFVACAAYEFCN